MADNKRKQYESFVTPRGVASWPHLNGPDTKYNKDGVYHTKLVFDPRDKDAAKFLDGLQEQLDAHIEELKESKTPKQVKTMTVNDVVQDELDDEGDPTGKKIVSFKMFATGKDKQGNPTTREPRFFDAKGQRIPAGKVPRLSGGSVLKIEYSKSGYDTPKGSGITLYLSNVQIIEAREYTGGGSSKFGDEGDGFVVEQAETFPAEPSSSEEGGAEDGDF